MRARTALFASVLALALALLPSERISADGFLEAPESIRAAWGVLMESLLDPDSEQSVPNPSVNFNLGAGIVLPTANNPRWAFEPSADLYWYYCGYINDRAVPVEETLSDAFVLGILVDAPFVYSFPISGDFSAGLGGGLALNLRIAFDTAPYGNLGEVYGYLWGLARFILPSALARVEYRLSERVECGLQLRAFLPVFNLWSPDSPSLLDQSMLAVGMSIRYRLR